MDVKKLWNEHRGWVIVGTAAIIFGVVCIYNNSKTVTVASVTTPPPPTPPPLTQTA